MKIEECPYCGKISLTDHKICETCREMIGCDENISPDNSAAEIHQAETPCQPETHYQKNIPFINAPNSEDAKQPWTEIKCWKCGTINIGEQTKICRQCGCFLKAVNVSETRNFQKESAKFRWFARLFVISFILIGGAVMITKALSYKTSHSPVGLPPGSWYKPSIWNYYRENPTVKEIIEKNNSVVSETVKPTDIKTLSFNGNISLAIGGCATEECLQKKSQIKAGIKAEEDAIAREQGFVSAPGNESPPEKLDDSEYFDNQSYIELGRVEAFGKKPDKFLRKSLMYRVRGSDKQDIYECLNGSAGWKKQKNYDHPDKSSIEDLVGEELEELKDSTINNWQFDHSETELTLLDIVSLNDQKEFLIQKQEGQEIEKLYFNAVSGQLDKLESGKIIAYFSLYQVFNGVKMPNKFCYKSISKEGLVVWLRIDNIEWHLNEPLDDAVFEKPIE